MCACEGEDEGESRAKVLRADEVRCDDWDLYNLGRDVLRQVDDGA